MKLVVFAAIVGLFSSSAATGQDKASFRLCTDLNFWAPYTFTLDGRAEGTHIDMVRAAFKAQALAVEITPLPWSRCLAAARAGRFDGAVSGAYRPDRAEDFRFPPGADARAGRGAYLSTAHEVGVVRSGEVFEWNGDRKSLPAPVGVVLGYSIAQRMADDGVDIRQASTYNSLFEMLRRGRVNSIMVMNATADVYMTSPDYIGVLEVLPHAYRPSYYHLMVAKKGRLGADQSDRLWQEISTLREDTQRMAVIKRAVRQKLQTCFRDPTLCQSGDGR